MPLDLGENVVVLPVFIALFHKTITWEEHQDATRSNLSDPSQGVSEINVDLGVFAVLVAEIEAAPADSLGED